MGDVKAAASEELMKLESSEPLYEQINTLSLSWKMVTVETYTAERGAVLCRSHIYRGVSRGRRPQIVLNQVIKPEHLVSLIGY